MADALTTDPVAPIAPVATTSVLEPVRGFVARAVATLRHRAILESVALLLPISLVGLTHADGPALWLVSAAYLAASLALVVRLPARSGVRPDVRWTGARLILSVAMVGAGQLLTGVTGLLAAVYLPIIAISAFAGRRFVALAVALAIVTHFGVETAERGTVTEALERTFGFAAAALLVGFGTSREVARLERARQRLRRAVVVDRRRARQIAGVEAIGRILAAQGPSEEAFDAVVGRIASEFGYRYVTIYLGNERQVQLGAQRGYAAQLIEGFDGEHGVVGRVMRTGRPAFVPDVGADPDYLGFDPDVTSEICVPLLADREFLGFVNVEATGHALDATDLRVMVAVADRLAAALIIGRERQRLSERADMFRHLHEFSEAVNGTLQPDELYRAIVRSVSSVVQADIAALHILDRESGRYLLRAVEGGELTLGAEARPGEGMAGRAIRDRTLIVDDTVPRPHVLRSVTDGFMEVEPPAPMLAASIPLVRDRAVLGALTLMRNDRGHRFSELERDAFSMLGQQAALAVTNVFLHGEVAELAVRDPLTGLFNRRYLDPALEQLFAQRSRMSIDERVPLAAIMFDLDHFSELNNRHGHQVGDEVLRAFGAVLRARMRSTDLVARFGGEEFAAVLFRATLDDAVRIADEVREQLASTPILGVGGEELSATVSAGCAAIGPEQESSEELLRAADVALYMAKRAGRDRVCAA